MATKHPIPMDLSSRNVEHAPSPMASVEGELHIVRYTNSAFCRLIGQAEDELVGQAFGELFSDENECVEMLDRVYRTGITESHIKPDSADHRSIFSSYTMWPMMTDARTVGVMLQVIETAPLRDRKLAMIEALILGSVRQHELTAAANAASILMEERFTASVSMAGISVFSVGMDLRYDWTFNPELFYECEDGDTPVGKHNSEMFAAMDAALLDTLFAQAFGSGLPQKIGLHLTSMKTQRERLLEILVDPLRDEDGQIIGLAGAAIDALPEFECYDKLRRAHIEADEARIRADDARTQADDARTQADDERTQADDARTQADDERTQADDARIQGDDGCNGSIVSRVASTERRTHAAEARDQAEAARDQAEAARIQADKARITAENARILADNARILAEMAGHAEDEAERIRAVEARSKAEIASRAKTRLMAAAGHDIRQPLQAMAFMQQMVQDRMKLHGDAPGMKAAEAIGQALASADELLTSLTSLATIEAGEVAVRLAEFPADDVMNSSVCEFAGMAEQKGLRLRVRPCHETIRSDPVLLKRIVRNLTVNAIKYTDRGGILVGGRRRGNCLRIDVWDTGRGIPKEQSAQIFEEFYRGDEARDPGGGLGIGLSIVTRMARLLGHDVTVRSREGKGSLFAVTVPLAQSVH